MTESFEPMTLQSLLLASTALLLPASLLAQSAPATDSQPASSDAMRAATPAPAEAMTDDEEGEAIVVTGQRPRGSVVGDIPAENVLTSRDIRATGATSIAELLDAVAAQTGSARGRDNGPPVLLLNGVRISGFRELRDLPPEAIERMEILPEEVALKYGYSADQRVVNIVLRRRFNSTSAELGGSVATEGGYAAGKADGTRLVIANGPRTSLNLHVEGNNPLYESERDIALDPAATGDARDARTLVGAAQSGRLTGTLNRTIFSNVGATVTAEAAHTHNRSRFGLSPFDADDVLTRGGVTDSAGLGFALNTQRGKWRLSSVTNAQIDRSTSDADASVIGVTSDDHSRSTRTSLAVDGTANGPLFALPAGDATATFKVGLSRLDLDAHALRRDVESDSDLGRTIGESSASLDLPLTKRASSIGRLTANLNAGLKQLSDFGSLTSVGAGMNWSASPRLNFITSWTREEGAPSLQALGDPLTETNNVPFFDAVRGETVNVTTLTGGNPELHADRRSVWKLGGNWQPSEKFDLRLRADFVHQTIDNPQISFPAATPALEAAFPERFVRDGSGELVSVDLRPVNADHSTRDTLRWGFDFTKPLKSKPPSAAAIAALRARFIARGATPGAAPGSAPATQGGAAAPGGFAVRTFGPGGGPGRDGPGGGGGRFGGGGPGGGRTGGRLTFSATHSITFTDKLDIGPGIEPLDYLHGEAAGSSGGRPRHEVEVETGYYNNGLGARLSGDWQSATRVNGGPTGEDLRFKDYATLDLRLFANLGERFDLVAKHPFFIGSSVRLEVRNILDSKPKVLGGNDIVPLAYQADRIEPIGRTIGISFRKLFLPSRFFRFSGPPGGRG